MWENAVVALYLVTQPRQPVVAVPEVRAVPGQGLEGDRPRKAGPDREVTLIESEAIEALKRDYGVELSLGDPRRNIVTRGVPLNHLVGREFRVGPVLLRGIRLCEPCEHLAALTQEKVRPGLVHRGGLRAQILTEGAIRVGDSLTEV